MEGGGGGGGGAARPWSSPMLLSTYPHVSFPLRRTSHFAPKAENDLLIVKRRALQESAQLKADVFLKRVSKIRPKLFKEIYIDLRYISGAWVSTSVMRCACWAVQGQSESLPCVTTCKNSLVMS